MIRLKSIKSLKEKIFVDCRKVYAELRLWQPGFTYSACGPFTKYCVKIKNPKRQVV